MEKNMSTGSPLSIILKFSLPLFIGNLFQSFYNMVDAMIVGRFVGEDALAAVGATGTIMFVVTGLATGLSTGFTVLTSQKYGEGNEEGTRKSVANGMVLSLIMVLALTVISLACMNPILKLMNTPDNIFEDASTYITAICIGMVSIVAYNFFAACLRAVGNSRIPLITLIISASINVALDLLFIRGFGWGVAGAAWATNLAQAVSAVICALYLCRKKKSMWPRLKELRLNRKFSRQQLQVGVPMALQFGITGSGTVIMQAAVNLFGSTAVAAYSTAGKITTLLMQGSIAIGQTMATYAGQNYGAKRPDRIRLGVRYAVGMNVVYSLCAAVLSNVGLPLFMQLFFDAQADMTQVLYFSRRYISICSMFYLPLSVIFTFRNTMQGCGYGLLPMLGGVVELVARLICAVVAMHTLSYTAACLCDPVAWLCAGIFTMIGYFIVMRNVERSGFREAD